MRGAITKATWAERPDRFDQKTYNKEYYQNNKEAIKAHVKEYTKRTGYRYKINDEQRERSNARARAWYEGNKQIVKDRAKLWKKANKEKVRANTRDYVSRKANAVGRYSTKDYIRLLRRNLNKCYYCHEKEANSIDHVLPLSRGGTNYIGNIVPACGSCNYSKGPRTLTEWKYGKSICTRDVKELYGIPAL